MKKSLLKIFFQILKCSFFRKFTLLSNFFCSDLDRKRSTNAGKGSFRRHKILQDQPERSLMSEELNTCRNIDSKHSFFITCTKSDIQIKIGQKNIFSIHFFLKIFFLILFLWKVYFIQYLFW